MQYFDNAAAVPVSPETLDRFRALSLAFFANQEASGAHARQCETAWNEAERSVLRLFGTDTASFRIFPVFSGTMAVRAGILAAADRFPGGGTVLITEAEHASVQAAVDSLPASFRRVVVPLRRSGQVDAGAFASAAASDTVLACVSHVQPETGAVQNVAELKQILSLAAPRAMLFCDTIQSAGKLPLPSPLPDLFAVSGQKLGVPGGAFLILRSGLYPFVRDLRRVHHGIERVPPAFSLLLAERLAECVSDCLRRLEQIRDVRTRLSNLLKRDLGPHFSPTVPDGDASPYLLHFLLGHGIQGAVNVRAMAERGFSIASGSACNAETSGPSRVLTAMGVSRGEAFSALRISFFDPVPDDALEALSSALKASIDSY